MEYTTFESVTELEIGVEIARLPGQREDKALVVSRFLGMQNGKFLYQLEIVDRVAGSEEGPCPDTV